ncbi:hypothetical protein [Pseudonocardia sp. TRM90224]|uniref:hypothetical protein n=1 Tax=Pseudonocardia sp. TRM90224 TaxID=2812678 RepID=UPI001E6229D4|nr:hypothetical protein [Pseudonocardia sp. TRM90224]
MNATVLIIVIVLVVLVAAAAFVLMRRRRSSQLQEQFGPEYERSVEETGDRRAAENQLAERRKRHSQLDVRELRPEERERYAASWDQVQRGFVDDPRTALHDADRLVVEVMRTRGYPVDDFDRRAEDISVEHPDVVQHYRDASRVRTASESGEIDTEQQRQAVTSYRSLVHALLGDARPQEDRMHDDRPDRADVQHNGAEPRLGTPETDSSHTRTADTAHDERTTR